MINVFHLQAYNDCIDAVTGWFTKIIFPKLQIFMRALRNTAVHYIFRAVISMYFGHFFFTNLCGCIWNVYLICTYGVVLLRI